MTDPCIVFYIFDDLNRFLECFTLRSESVQWEKKTEDEIQSFRRRKKFLTLLKVDGYFLSVFCRLIKVSDVYSKMVFNNLMNYANFTPFCQDISVKCQLIKPKLEILDYAWNNRISNLIAERQELEHAMSWLSTLGGAFSALGDSFESYAKMAGKISIQQFRIAFQLDEPLLVARCKLYLALSLIQLGKLYTAKNMVQNQYQIAKDFKDIRLQNMCRGVWAKLQYVYKEKKKSRPSISNISSIST